MLLLRRFLLVCAALASPVAGLAVPAAVAPAEILQISAVG